MRIGVIVQARVSSVRLPAKVLKELPFNSGITVLEQVIRRLKKSKNIDDIIIATTIDQEDDKIVSLAKRNNVKYFRGSKNDVLSRYYLAARDNNLDLVVRVTSDCPCVDPGIVDSIIEKYNELNIDYVSNSLKRTYPHGLDAEVFSFSALEKAYKNAQKNYEKEHVTPYIYENLDIFKVKQVESPKELYGPDIRITIDTEEDYALLCVIFEYLYSKNNFFDAKDIVGLFREKPWLKLINKKVAEKKIFETLDEEINEALKILDMQELRKTKDFLETHFKLKCTKI